MITVLPGLGAWKAHIHRSYLFGGTMGHGSRTQLSDRAIATDTPVTGLCTGSALILGSGSTTTQAAPREDALVRLLDRAAAEACTGRAALDAGNPTRPATICGGGAA
ncbi:hypothetical protein ARTHROSP310_06840 [Arthrobacter sp. AD-310]